MMKVKTTMAGALFFGLVTLALSGAQTESEDPFDTEQFDETVKASVEEDAANKVEILFGGTVVLRDYLLAPIDFSHAASEMNILAKPFVKVTDPRLGSVFLSFNIIQSIYQTTNDPASGLVPDDLFALSYSLSEFYVSFDLGKAVFIRAGNQINSWGPSFFWTPVDFINLQRINTLEALDLRTGIPGLKAHIPFGQANLLFFFDFRDTVTQAGGINDIFTTINAAARFDFTAGGFEFGLTGYLDAAQERLVNKYGFDVAGNILGFDLYTEQSVSLHYENSGGVQGFFNAYAASVGFERALDALKEWTLKAEFFYNSAGSEEQAVTLLPDRFVPYYTGKYYLFASIGKQKLSSIFINLGLSSVVNFTDLSFTIRLEATFSFINTLPITVSASYFGGETGDEFTLFETNLLLFSVDCRFVF